MTQTLFNQYILGAGWAMVLLLPMSVVALATFFRGASMLWGRHVNYLVGQVQKSASARTRTTSGAPVSASTEASQIAGNLALILYARFQVLALIYAAAPLVGALGSTWRLMAVWQMSSTTSGKAAGLALDRAFIPLGWGLFVALIAIIALHILRIRLAHLELNVFTPAAHDSIHQASERKPGDRKL